MLRARGGPMTRLREGPVKKHGRREPDDTPRPDWTPEDIRQTITIPAGTAMHIFPAGTSMDDIEAAIRDDAIRDDARRKEEG